MPLSRVSADAQARRLNRNFRAVLLPKNRNKVISSRRIRHDHGTGDSWEAALEEAKRGLI